MNDRGVPRQERGSQAQMAEALRLSYDEQSIARRDRGLPVFNLGPTDLDKIALMLTRGYSVDKPLSMEQMHGDLALLEDVLRTAAAKIRIELHAIRKRAGEPTV